MKKKTKCALAWMLAPPCIWFLFAELEEHLLRIGFLNKRDLGFVGGEEGTLYEYLTNVWHWDVAFGILLVIAAISFFIGLGMLLHKTQK